MKIFPSSVVAIAAPLSVALLSSPAGANDVGKGRSLFERRCTGCHRLDDIRSGPRLRGVVGRAAGSDAGFPYSDALKASRLTWSEATLDRWLADSFTARFRPEGVLALVLNHPAGPPSARQKLIGGLESRARRLGLDFLCLPPDDDGTFLNLHPLVPAFRIQV